MINQFTYRTVFILALIFLATGSFGQNDSTIVADTLSIADTAVSNKKKVDSALLHHSPRKAALRSAILPGWGQAYNKKYWKIPIVYGALGTSGGIFVYNITWYRRFREAYKIVHTKDTPNYNKVHPRLKSYVDYQDDEGLQYNRNEFRRNVDYSVLAFILLWGLNVVDATVDAHLKTFDVSPDLSLRIIPGYSSMAKTNGLSLVLSLK